MVATLLGAANICAQVWKLDLAPHVLPHLTRDNACLMQDGGSANGPLHLRSAEL